MSDREIELLLDADGVRAYLLEVWPQVDGAWTIESLTTSKARLRKTTSPADLRPGGTVSGPTLMALADSAAYVMVLGVLGRAALAVTSSLHIDFLRRPVEGDLIAEAELVKLGRSLVTLSVRLGNDASEKPFDPQKPVAIVSASYSRSLV
jgi:uncharacterized protein (TIGR00369 family)